jgi:hypothetical protein
MSGWRGWCARWSGAEAALVVAWGAFAAGLLAAALARSSAGILLLAAFCAWQMCDVWIAVHAEPDDAAADRATPRAHL